MLKATCRWLFHHTSTVHADYLLLFGVPQVVIPPITVRSSIGMTRVVIPPCTVRLSIGMTRVVIPPCTVRLSIGMIRVVFPPCMHSQVAYWGNLPPGGHSTTHRQGFIPVHGSSLVSHNPLPSYGYS